MTSSFLLQLRRSLFQALSGALEEAPQEVSALGDVGPSIASGLLNSVDHPDKVDVQIMSTTFFERVTRAACQTQHVLAHSIFTGCQAVHGTVPRLPPAHLCTRDPIHRRGAQS